MEPTPPKALRSPGSTWFAPYVDESKPWRSRSLLPLKPEDTHLALRDGKGKVASFDQNEGETFEKEVRTRANDLDLSVAIPAYDRWFPAILLFEPRERGDQKPRTDGLWKALALTLLLSWFFISPPRQLPIQGPQAKMFILLGLMMFGIMPLCSEVVRWWEDWRDRSPDRNKRRTVDLVLFDRWLGTFSSLVIKVTLVLLAAVYLLQAFGHGQNLSINQIIDTLFGGGQGIWNSVMKAALVKHRVMAGEWWRLITAGVMHGSIIHIYFNGSALYFLGRVTVAMVGSAMLGLVFLASIVGGSVASLYLSGGRPSVGASGGVMGILGFLTVILVLHKASIPQRYKVSLLQAIFIMTIFGALGAGFIDNAAHGGGFLIGALLGVVLVPRNERAWEYKTPKVIQILGWASWATLVAACFHVTQLLLGWNLY
ncbi:rhomboid family intramembrane serine protease [bacterium]|nr:rhomboid family intramembrane serine protease [bacterium]